MISIPAALYVVVISWAQPLSMLGAMPGLGSGARKPASGLPAGTLGVPGPYPGRVVEIRNTALKRDHEHIPSRDKKTLDKGLVCSPVRTIPSRPGGSSSTRGSRGDQSRAQWLSGAHTAGAGP